MSGRRGSRMEAQCSVSSADIQSEDDQGGDLEGEEDPLNWQSLVSSVVLASLTLLEIKRQEVINGESPRGVAVMEYTHIIHCVSLNVCVCVCQSCSTLSVLTCGL